MSNKLQGLLKGIIGLGLIIGIVGCSSKIPVGSSDSSAKILDSYIKKEAPEGWFYNFGIGSNYKSAMRDATDSLSFHKPLKVNTKISTTSSGIITSSGYKSREPEKRFDSQPYNVYNYDSSCEIIKNWDVPEGILIVRICQDYQYFKDNFHQDKVNTNEIQKDGHRISKLEEAFRKHAIKNNFGNSDIRLFYTFKTEIYDIGYLTFMKNYGHLSNEELLNFIYTKYKKWYNDIGYFNRESKDFLKIYYPHPLKYDWTRYEFRPNQFWLLDGVIVSRKLWLTPPQEEGYTQIDEISNYRFIRSKKQVSLD